MVQLEDVSKSYAGSGAAEAVLRGLNLTILPGQKLSLIGPSGCGKSTLLLLIAGLLRPDTGVISIDDVATSQLDDRARARIRARRIGIALQSDNLVPFLSAQENVELAFAFAPRRGQGQGQARTRALELLDRFGVAHRADQRPRQLSGGEAQRVALAVSMANEPALLLADEVVAQLDEDTAAGVIQEILAADFAVLYVTHEVAIADLADHRYALADHALSLR
ncbi:MAG: ATP-binding cassette domain-containing protein [Nocardioidaceae bacterium]